MSVRNVHRAEVTNSNPIVQFIFKEIAAQRASLKYVADRSGVSAATICHWRRRNGASLANVQAVLNVLGYELRVEQSSTS